MSNYGRHRFVFVGGLHRSGTSALYSVLATDPRVSIFQHTGVIEDEGQFLQSVYPPDRQYGGPGLFALAAEARYTETSPFVEPGRKLLFDQWSRHWDLTKPVLAEKSPANIIRSRFLSAVFENSGYLFMMRHPVASAMATTKWTGAYMTQLIENWIRAHDCLYEDVQHLESYAILKYESFVSNPELFTEDIRSVIGLDAAVQYQEIRSGLNDKYFSRWNRGDYHLKGPRWKVMLKRWRNVYEVSMLERKYEAALNRFGYSFGDLEAVV